LQEVVLRSFDPIKNVVRDTLSNDFDHIRIVDVRVRDDVDSDGSDVLRIDIIFEGDAEDLDAVKLSGAIRQLCPKRANWTNWHRSFRSYPRLTRDPGSVLPRDLLETAKDLASYRSGRPRQAHLRRAVSTRYYALFHTLAKSCADLVIGSSRGTRSEPAWNQVYRSLQHGFVRESYKQNS
jgi:hypothetical protein